MGYNAMSYGMLLLLAIPFVILLAVGLTVLLAMLLRGGGGSGAESRREEARMIQEMYAEVAKLGSRVEALETLLLDVKGRTEDTQHGPQ